MILALEETLLIGTDSWFDSVSFNEKYGVFFEDDTQTGYFYAIDMENDQNILDAVHIYDVARVIDKHKPSKIQIAWDDTGMIASLVINNYCHPIFDFRFQFGYCRNNFPEPNSLWTKNSDRTLTDELIEEIFRKP